jgi:hypothetical protein
VDCGAFTRYAHSAENPLRTTRMVPARQRMPGWAHAMLHTCYAGANGTRAIRSRSSGPDQSRDRCSPRRPGWWRPRRLREHHRPVGKCAIAISADLSPSVRDILTRDPRLRPERRPHPRSRERRWRRNASDFVRLRRLAKATGAIALDCGSNRKAEDRARPDCVQIDASINDACESVPRSIPATATVTAR